MAIRSLKSGTFSRSGLVGNPVIMPGSYESIATVTVGAGGASTITFSSIPSTYTHLQIRGIANVSTVDGLYPIRFNSDTGANYAYHRLTGNGTTTGTANGTSMTGGKANVGIGFPSGTNIFGPFIMDILDYANTNKYKTMQTLTGGDSNGSGGVEFDSGVWMSTSAISTILLTAASGTFPQYTTFALYGVN